MGFCRCRFFSSSCSTCLTTVLFLLTLLPLVSLLKLQQQPLHLAAARLIVEYPDSAGSCPVSIETHFAPWQQPIKSSKASRLRYFPNTCNVQQYYFHAAKGPSVGVEFLWLHADPAAVAATSPLNTASADGGAVAASASAPLVAVFILQNGEASSFPGLPQPHFVAGTPNSSVDGSVNDGKINPEVRGHVVTPFLRRLAGVFFSPSPMLRPLWTVHSSALPYLIRSADSHQEETNVAAGEGPGTSPTGTLTAPARTTAAAVAPTVAAPPTAAAGVQDAKRLRVVGAMQRRLSKPGEAPGVEQQRAAKQHLRPSAVDNEYTASTLFSRNSRTVQRSAARKDELPRAASGTASPTFVEPEAAASMWSILTGAPDATFPPTAASTAPSATASTSSHSSASPYVGFPPTASSAPFASESPGLPGFPGLYSTSTGTNPPYTNLGAVVLHGGAGGDITQGDIQKRRRSYSSRWRAIVRAADAIRELHKAALQNGNTFTRWLLPWPPEPIFIPYISIQRLRGNTGGGEGETEKTDSGTEPAGGRIAAARGMMTYAVNGIAAAVEALEGLPQDDEEFVDAAAAFFDNDEEQTRMEEDDDGVRLKGDEMKAGMSRSSSLGLKSSVVPPAVPKRIAPVHMSRLQWSGGKPFPVFERSNVKSAGNREEAVAAEVGGRKRSMKRRKKRKSKKGKVERQMLEEFEALIREAQHDAENEKRQLRGPSRWDTEAVGAVAATHNPVEASAVGERTLEEQVGTLETEAAPVETWTAAAAEQGRKTETERKMKKETGTQTEDHTVAESKRKATATTTAASATAVTSQEGKKRATAEYMAGNGSETGAAVRGAAAAAGGKPLGDETVADKGKEAVAARREEATAAVDEEVVAVPDEWTGDELRFLGTNMAWVKSPAGRSPHSPSSSPGSSRLYADVAANASPAGAGVGSSPGRRLLSEGVPRNSRATGADEQWQQKKQEHGQRIQQDVSTSARGTAAAIVSPAWAEGNRNGRESAHSSAGDSASAGEEIRPAPGWREEGRFRSVGERQPSDTVAGRTAEYGRVTNDKNGATASSFGGNEIAYGAAPRVTAKKTTQGEQEQRYEMGSSRSLRTARTSRTGTGAAPEVMAAGRIAAVISAPKIADEDEFWLFDRCHDEEQIRRIIVAAHVIGARAVIFTDTSFSSHVPSPALSFGTINAATPAVVGGANAVYAGESARPSLLSPFAAPAAVAYGSSFHAGTFNPFIASGSSAASASMPVFSIPDSEETRSLKEQLLQQTSVRVAVDTLPADVASCHPM